MYSNCFSLNSNIRTWLGRERNITRRATWLCYNIALKTSGRLLKTVAEKTNVLSAA